MSDGESEMIKQVVFLKKRADMTMQEFMDYSPVGPDNKIYKWAPVSEA